MAGSFKMFGGKQKNDNVEWLRFLSIESHTGNSLFRIEFQNLFLHLFLRSIHTGMKCRRTFSYLSESWWKKIQRPIVEGGGNHWPLMYFLRTTLGKIQKNTKRYEKIRQQPFSVNGPLHG